MSLEVPEGWRSVRVGDVAEIRTGGTPSRTEEKYWGGDVPWMASGEIHQRYVSVTAEKITELALKESNARILPVGSIMIALNGQGKTRGKAAILRKSMACNQSLAAILPNAAHVPDFFLFLFESMYSQLRNLTGDDARNGLNLAILKALEVSLPPLHEQRRIAEILFSVDEAIAATRAVIEQTRKVKQGVLERLLTKGIGHTRFKQTEIGEIPEGWDLKRLRDLAIHITSGSRGWAQYYSDEGDLFLRSQNVRDGSLDLSDKQFVTVPKSAEGSRTLVQADDLVFTITGNSVGNIARIPADFGNAYVSQHVALVRLRDRQLSAFLESFFSPSGPGNNQILSAQYGQSKPGLSLENVRSLYVPAPPHHELAQLSEIVKDHGVYEMNVAKELSHLISLKSALMSDLLTGRKRVTDALPLAAE